MPARTSSLLTVRDSFHNPGGIDQETALALTAVRDRDRELRAVWDGYGRRRCLRGQADGCRVD